MTRLALLLALVAAAAPASASAPAAAAPGTLLVVTETAGFRHGAAIAAGLEELRALQAREGVTVREVKHFASLTPERLAGARGLVLLQTSGTPRFSDQGRAGLLRAVRSGLPLLAFHASASTFPRWTAFHRLLGARFRDHPNVGVGRVRVEDRTHPATAALPASFALREEYYRFQASPDPRRDAHVLASLDLTPFGGKPAGDRPLVWWRMEGRGRVFYDALGHRPETWRNPLHRKLLQGALDWALARTP